MSLFKTTVPIPMDGALNNKIAEKLLPQGQFLDLQNVVRRKQGQYHKRYGFTSLSLTTLDGEVIDTGRGLDRFNLDLLLFSDANLYSYSSARDRWIDKGTIVPMAASSSAVIRNNDQQRYGDVAVLNGLEVYVWEDSRGGVRYMVRDVETGATVVNDVEVASAGVLPRVIALSSCFLIAYIDTGSVLKCRRITIGEPDVLGTANSLASNVATTAFYDIEPFNDVALITYNNTTDLMLGYVTATGEIGSSGGNGYPDPVIVSATNFPAGAIVSDEEGLRAYVLAGDTSTVVAYAYAQDLVVLDDLTLTAGAGGNITAVLEGSGVVRWFAETESATATSHSIACGVFDFDGTVLGEVTAPVSKSSIGLVSKAFRTNGRTYFTAAYQSDLQSSYFLMDEDANVVAKMATSRGAGLNYTNSAGRRSLTHVAVGSGEYVTALSVKNRLTTVDATTASGFVGIDRFAYDYDRSNLDSSSLGKNLHFAGGVVSMYDGRQVVEHGFFLYPEGVTATATTGGSMTSSKPYRVRALYEWVDGQGQIHRSAPSAPVSVSTGGSDTALSCVIPSLKLTAKDRVKIVVYRTKADEVTVYYRANEALIDASATTTILLTSSDATVATKEILYTVGGTLDNIVAPAPVALCTHGNRTWVVSAEDNSLWYSREHVEGEGVAFSDGQKIKFDNGTAIGSLDERLAVFTDSSISIVAGRGPLDSGAQNDFTTPEEIASDVGCIDYRSLVEGPFGIMFKSKKGIYLLDQQLSPQYIGAPVENYNDLTITSAVVIEDDNEVRFTTETGVCLVYNYYFGQWYTFSNYSALGAVYALDTYCHVKDDGTVHKQVAGQYNDNGQRYSMLLETNWMQFAKLQGFQRIYYWSLLGDFISHCHCRVKIQYDFEDVTSETVYFNTVSGLGTGVYGDGVYGEAEVYGGTGSQVFQFRSKPSRQKCEAFKMRIEDVDTISDAGGGSFALTALSLEVGTKTGLAKMSNAKTRGSN